MQLFSRKKKKDEAEEQTKPVSNTQKRPDSQQRYADVLVRPHITEKAAVLADSNGYVFRVSPDATKIKVKRAIKEVYGKEPVKVNIAKKSDRSVLRRKGRGVRKGYKKAYVFLKKGETIDIV